MDEEELNITKNSKLNISHDSLENQSNKTSQEYSYNNINNSHSNNIYNNYKLYANSKNQLRNPNDFIFLGDELHLYREIPHLGNFYSYKNKSVKGIFIDKTICMMNQDQYYTKIINKYGEKILLYIPALPANNPYYVYIKHLFDFYDSCFNPQIMINNAKKKLELEKQIDERINKIDLFNNLIFNKSKEENYSKQYYSGNNPTFLDIQNLLKRNQKALDNIEKIKNENQK